MAGQAVFVQGFLVRTATNRIKSDSKIWGKINTKDFLYRTAWFFYLNFHRIIISFIPLSVSVIFQT